MKLRRRLPVLLLLGVALLVYVYSRGNFWTVETATLYRSGQLSAESLTRRLQKHNIQTVVNLRGAHPDEQWYREEKSACAQAKVRHFDLPWTMRALPSPQSLAILLEIFDSQPLPILVHCQGGTHRSGVASACYLLSVGKSVAEAREQFGVWFGDAPIGDLLNLYEGSELPFRQWVVAQFPNMDEADL